MKLENRHPKMNKQPEIHTRQGKPLTRAQAKVVGLLAKGLTFKEIARELGVSDTTVKAHADDSRERTGAKNVAHLVFLCCQQGLLSASMPVVFALIISSQLAALLPRDTSQPTQPPVRLTRTVRTQRREDLLPA